MTIKDNNQALQFLDSPVLEHRKDAIVYLNQHNYKEAIPWMLDLLLNDPDPGIRMLLIQSLTALEAKESIPYLMDLMQVEPEQSVRVAALSALGQLKAEDSVPLVLEVLKQTDMTDKLRQMALQVLQQLEQPSVVSDLIHILKSSEFPLHLKPAIVRVLISFESFSELICSFKDLDKDLQEMLLSIFEQVDITKYMTGLFQSSKVSSIEAALLLLQHQSQLDLLPVILKHFPEWSSDLQEKTLTIFNGFKPSDTICKHFMNLESEVQQTALKWIKTLKLKPCRLFLLENLIYFNAGVQSQAIMTLKALDIDLYLEHLIDKGHTFESNHIKALALLKIKSVIPHLIHLYSQAQTDLQQEMINTFKALQAENELIQLAHSTDSHRLIALIILQQMQNPLTAKDIVTLVKDKNANIALTTLAIIKDFQARELISPLLERFHLILPDIKTQFLDTLAALKPKNKVVELLTTNQQEQLIINVIQVVQALKLEEAAPYIVRHLFDKTWKVRVIGIQTLTTLEAKDSIQKLLPLVEYRHPKLLSELKAFFLHFQAEKILEQWLFSSDSSRQIHSIRALHLIQAKEAIPSLLKLLAESKKQVKAYARQALSELDVRKTINQMLKSPNPDQVFYALQGVYYLKITEELETAISIYDTWTPRNKKLLKHILDMFNYWDDLIEVFASSSFEVQVNILEIIKDARLIDLLPQIIGFALETDGALRERVIQCFRSLDGIMDVHRRLKHDLVEPELKNDIIDLSIVLKDLDMVPSIIHILLNSNGPIQDKSLQALRKMNALQEVLRLLSQSRPQEQLRGIQALGHLGAHLTIPLVIAQLSSPDSSLQVEAIQTLKLLNARQASPHLIDLAISSQNLQVQENCLLVLDTFLVEQQLIPEMLISHEAEQRMKALQIWHMLNPQNAHKAITDALSDPRPDIRMLVLDLLAQNASPENLPFIVQAISDIQPLVRQRALSHLVRLSPGKGIQYLLDEMVITSKMTILSYQRSLLNILLTIPLPYISQRLIPLLDNQNYINRFERLIKKYMPEMIDEDIAGSYQLILTLASNLKHNELSQYLWELIDENKVGFKQFLSQTSQEAFVQYPAFQSLINLLINFSNFNRSDISYFLGLTQEEYHPKLYLKLVTGLYRQIEKKGSEHVQEEDMNALELIFSEACQIAEEKYPKALPRYEQYVDHIQEIQLHRLDNIIPLQREPV